MDQRLGSREHPVSQIIVGETLLVFIKVNHIKHKGPLSMGFSWQEYWSGLPFSPPRDLPDPGIELMSPAFAGEFFTPEPPGKPFNLYITLHHLPHSALYFVPRGSLLNAC